MPRFVVLRDELPGDAERTSHWDLMFEYEGVLRTWSVMELPPLQNQEPQAIAAEQLADHRLAYLDYEGPVSGHRGTVTRCDHGSYQVERYSPELWQVQVESERLSGRITLTCPDDDTGNWQLQYCPRPI